MVRPCRNRSPADRNGRAPGSAPVADANGGSVRLFFALIPDLAVRAGLVALASDVARSARGRAPAAANIHLTLAFLGAVAGPRLPALQQIGATVAAATSPFLLVLDRVGSFLGSGIAWAGTEAIPAELGRLVLTLNRALDAAGFALETRPFHPHVTLARRCIQRPESATIEALEWSIDRIALMASDTRSDGPVYRELAAWPLTGSPAAAPR